MKNPLGRDISHIQVTAGLAVLVLVGIGIWQVALAFEARNSTGTFVAVAALGTGAQNTAVASSDIAALVNSDPVTAVSTNALGEVVGAYAELQQSGQYSSSTATDVANTIGMGLSAPITYTPLNASQISTTPDTSYAAMMSYRTKLQLSMKPLLNNTEPEYQIFGLYVETKDPKYLTQLHDAADNYRAAASSTALITVPADAVQVDLDLINSMNEFGATLDTLADHASDPIGSSVLLENYDSSENDVLTAFQNLVIYEQSKTQ